MAKIDLVSLIHDCRDEFAIGDDAEQALDTLRIACQDTDNIDQPVELAIESLIEIADEHLEYAKSLVFAAARIGGRRRSSEPQLDYFQPELIARCAIVDCASSDSEIDWDDALQNACQTIDGIEPFATTPEIQRMLRYVYRARAVDDFLKGRIESAVAFLERLNQVGSADESDEFDEDSPGAETEADLIIPAKVMGIMQEIMALGPLEAYSTAYDLIGAVEGKTEWEEGEIVNTRDVSASIGARIGLFLHMTKHSDVISKEQTLLFNQVTQLAQRYPHDPGLDDFIASLAKSSVQPLPDDLTGISKPESTDDLLTLMGYANALVERKRGAEAVKVIEVANEGIDGLDLSRDELRNFYVAACKSYYALAEEQHDDNFGSLHEALKNIDLAIAFEDDNGRPRSSLFNRKSRILCDLDRYDEALPAALEAVEHADPDELSLRSSIVTYIASKIIGSEELTHSARAFLKSYVSGLLRYGSHIERLAYCADHRGQLQWTVMNLCEGGAHDIAFRLWEAGKAIDARLAIMDPVRHGQRKDDLLGATALERERRLQRLLAKQSLNLRGDSIPDIISDVQALADEIVEEAMEGKISLPDDAVYLSYCLHKDKHGWLFVQNGATFIAERLSFGIEEARRRFKPSPEQIIPPIAEEMIKPARQVLVSPDDGLWQVQFLDVLDVIRDKEYALVESIGALQLSSQRKNNDGPIVLAGSTYSDTDNPLPLSGLAVSYTSQQYGDHATESIVDSSFTKRNLLSLMASSPRLLHLVGHASFAGKDRNNAGDTSISGRAYHSGFEVTPEGAVQTEYRSENHLTILDMEGTASPIDLITLSCCESALGEPLTEGLVGLPLGLRSIGTRALVATLESTPEIGTLFVMAKLHSYLAGGLTVGRALLQVRRWADGLSDSELTAMSKWLESQPEATKWMQVDSDNSTDIGYLGAAIKQVEKALVLIGDPNVCVITAS